MKSTVLQKSFSSIKVPERGIIYTLALYAVLFFIFLIPWADGLSDGLAKLFGIIAFGTSSLVLVIHGSHRNYSYFHFFVLLLWSWIIFSVVWTPNLQAGMETAPRLFQIMLLPFLFTLIITSRNDILRAYQAYVLGNIIGSSIIIYNYLHGIESPYYNRYTVPNIETDVMSIILALSIPMAAYLSSNLQSKLGKIIYTSALPLIIFAIFLTGTRTGSIVAVIGIMYWLFTHRNASIKVKASILIVFILSIIVVVAYAPKASTERVFSAGKSIKSGNLNYRTVIWGASIEQWKRAPIIGTGLGGLSNVLSEKHVNFAAAHNTHIQILTENGLIGVFLYIMLELSVLLVILQAPYPDKVFLLSLFLSIVVSQLTLHTHTLKETWFALTIIVIHSLLSTRKNQKRV